VTRHTREAVAAARPGVVLGMHLAALVDAALEILLARGGHDAGPSSACRLRRSLGELRFGAPGNPTIARWTASKQFDLFGRWIHALDDLEEHFGLLGMLAARGFNHAVWQSRRVWCRVIAATANQQQLMPLSHVLT